MDKLIERPPVVVVMGHIDHGKSTLLDYIRKTNIAEKEVGGITQSISAYEATHNNKKITFLDTPGHEAFSEVRGRGVEVADIAVLVVSAEDGVKPQTIEAYKQIKAIGLPFIVVLNKIDKENANVDRAKQSLLENEIYTEGSGGDTPIVNISSKTGVGVPELLDLINLIAEIEGLKANPNLAAEGVIIEVGRSTSIGNFANMIIKSGTLKLGMFVATGESVAPVRLLQDWQDNKLESASFSTPVRVSGFSSVPVVGSFFHSFYSRKEAEDFIESPKKPTTETTSPINDSSKFIIPIIIKADNSGIVEAIEYELKKMETEKMGLRVLYSGIGDITDDDIKIASGKPETIVIGFNSKAASSTNILAGRMNVTLATFDIIYKLDEWLRKIIVEKAPKIETEEKKGSAKIIKLFSENKDKQIVGGKVEEGLITVGDNVKIFRREALLGNGKINELQQLKSKITSIGTDSEFGAMIESKITIATGDKIESFQITKK